MLKLFSFMINFCKQKNIFWIFFFLFILFFALSNCQEKVNSKSTQKKLEKENFTIIFNFNNGSSSKEIIIQENEKVTKPNDPTKTGHKFINWFLDHNFNSVFDFNTLVASNFTLYAKWQKNIYQINFEKNGGSAIAIQNISYKEILTKPNDPTKNDYTFDNWFSDQNFNSEFNFNTPITSNFTLYAKWLTIRGHHYNDKDFSDSGSTSPYAVTKYQEFLYILDTSLKKVFVYDKNGNRDNSRDFDLNSSNGNAHGITYYNEKFYITDNSDNKIYLYNKDGTYLNSINLISDNGNAYGITFGNNNFYITDSSDDKVYVYDTDFNHASSLDFSVAASGNTSPFGITYYKLRLYITDSTDDKVYCYQIDGTRDTSKEFDTVDTGVATTSNGDPKGIFAFQEFFYIVDSRDDKIYVYGAGE